MAVDCSILRHSLHENVLTVIIKTVILHYAYFISVTFSENITTRCENTIYLDQYHTCRI